jgi:Tfp pilus assembly protein PilX
MTPRRHNENGSAMIMALGALAILAVIAIAVVAIVISEKRTGFSEYAGSRAFYSADAASEAGVNWIRHEYTPPATVDSLSHVHIDQTYTTIATNNRYKFDVTYIRKRYRSGWSNEYKDYEFRVDAVGTSTQQTQSAVEVRATRLYREGY